MGIDNHYEAFLRGVEEFNTEKFYECHDTWEEIWYETTGVDKLFLQGLIHAAVGLYHFTNKRAKGARSQLEKCVRKLSSYEPQYRGISVSALRTAITQDFFPAIDALEKSALEKSSSEKSSSITAPPFPKLALSVETSATPSTTEQEVFRVSLQNDVIRLKAELSETKEKLKREQAQFASLRKRFEKDATRKVWRLYAVIAILAGLCLYFAAIKS
jgi:uncharacterized protein